MATNTCNALQKSLAWCQGTPELPGVKRRIFYIAKADIADFPTLPHDDRGRTTSAVLSGDFVLKADRKWKFIDILPDKSQLTSEAQGELPSQTQLNKLTAVHPGVGEEATAAAAYINNTDSIFIVEDMKGNYRVLGNDKWSTKATVTQDLGQGATGTTSTTINVEATDEVPAPFYKGVIDWEENDMILDESQSSTALFTFTTRDYNVNLDSGFADDSNVKVPFSVQDPSILSYGDIIEFVGIKGYNNDGTESSDYLKAFVIQVSDSSTNNITCYVINGPTVADLVVFPSIPANTKVVIVSL